MLVRLNIYLSYLKPNIRIISNSLSLRVQQFQTIIKHVFLGSGFSIIRMFLLCDVEGKLNEWIKLFRNTLKFHQTWFIIDDCSEGDINKKEMHYQNLLLAVNIGIYGS